MQPSDYIKVQVDAWRIDQLQQDSRDLKRAKGLIHRLRVENNALKLERKTLRTRATQVKRMFLDKKAYAHAYGAMICNSRCQY